MKRKSTNSSLFCIWYIYMIGWNKTQEKKKLLIERAQLGSNWRPLDFQSNALPLSYGPLLFHHHSFLKYYFSKLYFKSIETSLFPSTKTSTLWIRLSSISPSITPPHFYREEKSNNSYLVRYTTHHSSHLLSLEKSHCGILLFFHTLSFCFLWNLM